MYRAAATRDVLKKGLAALRRNMGQRNVPYQKQGEAGMRASRRLIGAFCVFILGAMAMYFRLYYLTAGGEFSMASDQQSSRTLTVASNRGLFYDRNLQPLVNLGTQYRAAVLPDPMSAGRLLKVVEPERQQDILEILQQGRPFVMNLEHSGLYARGVHVFSVYQRYSDPPLAAHLIGYTDSGGSQGVAGLEKGYDSLLQQPGASIEVTYLVNARGTAVAGAAPEISQENYEVKSGVMLTLDREIQTLCEQVARGANGFDKGAILVMEPETGDILASVSLPDFSQNNVAEYLEAEDSPFLNRAFSAYNVGSTFKLVVAATALENGISAQHRYTCTGMENVGGQIFYCNNLSGHGSITMEEAVEHSCNTYFIHLMEELGPDLILHMAESMGFGTSESIAAGISISSGNLPTRTELNTPAEAANLSFGQGKLLATPLQIAKMLSVIVNGGHSVTPRLVEGTVGENGLPDQTEPRYASNPILKTRTAALLRQFLVKVVEEGSGSRAKPAVGGAGGKTGSAQTGLYEEDGETEKVHAWFAGFYPAQEPEYVIVVFVEDGESGALKAAPVFRQIADGLYLMRKDQEPTPPKEPEAKEKSAEKD